MFPIRYNIRASLCSSLPRNESFLAPATLLALEQSHCVYLCTVVALHLPARYWVSDTKEHGAYSARVRVSEMDEWRDRNDRDGESTYVIIAVNRGGHIIRMRLNGNLHHSRVCVRVFLCVRVREAKGQKDKAKQKKRVAVVQY